MSANYGILGSHGASAVGCAHCHTVFHKGQDVRYWNGEYFCNEYDQASFMLRWGKAKYKPAKSDCRTPFNHYVFKGKPSIHYQKQVFCDFEEFAQFLREYGIGTTEIVGEKVVAL